MSFEDEWLINQEAKQIFIIVEHWQQTPGLRSITFTL
jgi:hypothetical protein